MCLRYKERQGKDELLEKTFSKKKEAGNTGG